MSVSLTIKANYPRWGRSYLGMLAILARAGIEVDEDAAVERVKRATVWEAVDAAGNRHLLDVG